MHEAFERNQAQSQRLSHLCAALTAEKLQTLVHGGWTVAAQLSHIAFWDRIALAHLDRWVSGQPIRVDTPQWYDDILNDSLLAESLALDAAAAARLAEEATSVLDARLLGLGAATAARLEADAARPETDASWLLHRYRHRAGHLDEIEAALRERNRL